MMLDVDLVTHLTSSLCDFAPLFLFPLPCFPALFLFLSFELLFIFFVRLALCSFDAGILFVAFCAGTFVLITSFVLPLFYFWCFYLSGGGSAMLTISSSFSLGTANSASSSSLPQVYFFLSSFVFASVYRMLVISARLSSFLKCCFRLSPFVAFKSKPWILPPFLILGSSTCDRGPMTFEALWWLLMKEHEMDGTWANGWLSGLGCKEWSSRPGCGFLATWCDNFEEAPLLFITWDLAAGY